MGGAFPVGSLALGRLVRRGGIALAVVVGLFGVWEAGLTIAYGTPGPFRVVEALGSPYVFVTAPREDFNNLSIRRGENTSLAPDPGTFRVLSYGDSIAGGFGLETEQSYAHLVEQELDGSSGRRYEVLNMARGHSPSVYAFHVRVDVPRLAPSAVIVQIELLNDVSDEAHVETRGRDADGLPEEILNHRYVLTYDGFLVAPVPKRAFGLERTKAYYAATRRLSTWQMDLFGNPVFAEDTDTYYYSLRSDRYMLTRDVLDAGFDRMFETLAGIGRYLRRQDIGYLVLLVPPRYAFKKGQFAGGALRLFARAEKRARELGLPVLSLGPAMAQNGGDDLYMDFCHPTVEGHRVIARTLAPALRQLAKEGG